MCNFAEILKSVQAYQGKEAAHIFHLDATLIFHCEMQYNLAWRLKKK